MDIVQNVRMLRRPGEVACRLLLRVLHQCFADRRLRLGLMRGKNGLDPFVGFVVQVVAVGVSRGSIEEARMPDLAGSTVV